MFKQNVKKTLVMLSLAMGVGIAAAPAHAFSLGGYTGDIKLVFSNVDSATTGYAVMPPAGTVVCGTIAACDIAGTSPAPGGIGSEDTWGLAVITAIQRTDTSAIIWQPGQDGEYLSAMFYGLADHTVTYAGSLLGNDYWQTLSFFGKMDVYIDTVDNFNTSTGPAGRGNTGLGGYGITDGSLFLSTDFMPGVNAGDVVSTYTSTFTTANLAGAGVGYLNVTGGSHASLFDTQSITDPNGNKRDLTFDVTYNATGAAPWSVVSAGQALGQVPEPASLALMGIGLLGLGAASIRRKKKAS